MRIWSKKAGKCNWVRFAVSLACCGNLEGLIERGVPALWEHRPLSIRAGPKEKHERRPCLPSNFSRKFI